MTQACLLFLNVLPAAAATAPNTAITNMATASYLDTNAVSYTAQMTLTIYVQNAPTLTVTPPTGKNVTVGDNAIDTFTLTNTGNGSGHFELSANASNAGNGTATIPGYVLNGATSSTCSTVAPCLLATLQTQLAGLGATATGGSITIGVVYIVTSATYGNTLQYSISPDISYPAGSNTAQASSAAVTSATFSDTIVSDARLDIQVVSTPPPSSGANIAWAVTANDGGTYAAHDLASAKTLLGAGANGVALFIKVPVYNGAALALASQPTAPTVSGDTVTMYYSSKTVGSPPASASDWSTTYSSSATWIAVYLSGGAGGVELASAPSGSSGAGAVTTPQVSFTFNTLQPGSGMVNIVTLVANSAIGGNVWDTGTIYPVIAPGIASGTADGTSQALTAAENNTTPGSGILWPGGASNSAGNQGYGMSVITGPLQNAAATGSYPVLGGTATATANLDFTALGFACANGSGVYSGGTANCTVPSNIQIPNTVQNTGNLTDVITISVTPPAGWTAQIFTATCATPTTVVPTCTSPVSISGVSAAGTLVTSTGITLAANATQDYVVQYNNASSVTPFTGVDALVRATGSTADTNDTHNDLYPGGVISIVTTASTTSNCPAGVTVTTVCPGGLIKYVTAYTNVAPAGSVTAPTLGTEPSFAYAALKVGSAGLTITSDGSGSGWASNTFGLNGTGVTGSAVPVASDASNTTVTAYTGCSAACVASTAWASGTYPSISAGPNKITAAVAQASATVFPGGSGTLTYYVTVK